MRFLVVLCAVLAAMPAIAATENVQDRDEPGRNPYQSATLSKEHSFRFTTVPNNERLVIKYVSCAFSGSVDIRKGDTLKPILVRLFPTGEHRYDLANFVAVPYVQGNGIVYKMNEQTLFYVEENQTPILFVDANFSSAMTDYGCFISGYLIDLQK